MPTRIIGVCFEDIRCHLWPWTLEWGTDESSRAACETKASKIHVSGQVVEVELRKVVDQVSRTVTLGGKSMTDFWMENAFVGDADSRPHRLLDLGYVKHKATRDRADELLAFGIGRKNFQIVAYGRLLMRILPSKHSSLLAAFPGIEEKTTYSWCTHSWIPEGANDLAYALK